MDIEERTFFIINTPLCFYNIAVNIFFAICLIFPVSGRQELKEPRKTLLKTIVCCSLFYLFFTLFFSGFKDHSDFPVLLHLLIFLFKLNAEINMTCHVWLNFYYYTQIVPAHQELSIWVKKNIKLIIYGLLVFDGIIFLISCSLDVVNQLTHELLINNGTLSELSPLDDIYFVWFLIAQGLIFISSVIMVVCNFSTAHYLRKHVKNMAKKGSSLTNRKVQSQIRVASTGIFQGILCFCFYIFYIFDTIIPSFTAQQFFSIRVSIFGISLYIIGITVSLGIGQGVFRKKAARIWKGMKANICKKKINHDLQQHPATVKVGSSN